MTFARVSSLTALPISAVVTFGLFLIMTLLVAGDGIVHLDKVQNKQPTILAELPPKPAERLKRNLIKPEPVKVPDKIEPIREKTLDITNDGFPIVPPKAPRTYQPGGPHFGQQADGEYLPLVRVQPIYPRRARERGIEGYAIVELTVGADGSVPPSSVKVIETEPRGYFGDAAINAAKKFKYKPKIINGKGHTVTGVTYRFSFTLKD